MAKNVCGCDENDKCNHAQVERLEHDLFNNNMKKSIWNNSSIFGRLWILLSNNQPD